MALEDSTITTWQIFIALGYHESPKVNTECLTKHHQKAIGRCIIVMYIWIYLKDGELLA